MSNWQAVGGIFCALGAILIIIGILNGVNATAVYDQTGLGQFVPQQVKNSLFWAAAQSYLISGVVLFAIGCGGFYAGRNTSQTIAERPSPIQPTSVNKGSITVSSYGSSKAVLSKSRIICGSCETINEIDAFYCKKCASQLRGDSIETKTSFTEQPKQLGKFPLLTERVCPDCGAKIGDTSHACGNCGRKV